MKIEDGDIDIGNRVKFGKNVVVSGSVKIGHNVEFGNNVVISGNIAIGDNNKFGNNVVIEGNVEIGNNNHFSDYISIGKFPQHMRHKFELNKNYYHSKKKIVIGSNNVFREFITIHMPLEHLTYIGSNCYIMDYCHISHDTHIFDNVNMANNCQIGGHTIILNDTNIGLSVTIHQNTTIGAYCMIGMGSVIIRDIPPFLVVAGNPASMIGVNKKGLEFRGIDRSIIKDVEELYSKRPLKLESNNDFINEELRKFLIYSKRKIIDI